MVFSTLSPSRRAMKFYLLALEGVIAAALTGASTAVAMLTPAMAAVLKLLVVTPEGWSRRGWASLGLHRAVLRSFAQPNLSGRTGLVSFGRARRSPRYDERSPSRWYPLVKSPVLQHVALSAVARTLRCLHQLLVTHPSTPLSESSPASA